MLASYIKNYIDLLFVIITYAFVFAFPSPISLGLVAVSTANYVHKRYVDSMNIKKELIKYDELKKMVDEFDSKLTTVTSKIDSIAFNSGVKTRVTDMSRM